MEAYALEVNSRIANTIRAGCIFLLNFSFAFKGFQFIY